MKGRGEPLCQDLNDKQMAFLISMSHALSSSHFLSLEIESSQTVSAIISLQSSMCFIVLFSCPHLGQSECSCHFQHSNYFSMPQILVVHFEIHTDLDVLIDLENLCDTNQSTDVLVSWEKIFSLCQYLHILYI